MATIILKKAVKKDLNWINEQYRNLNFLPSDLNQEYVVIAQQGIQRCGIGRLIHLSPEHEELGGMFVSAPFRKQGIARQIVSHLLEQRNPSCNTWCIPLKHLIPFYSSFGFIEVGANYPNIPDVLARRINWCDQNQDNGVSLLLIKSV